MIELAVGQIFVQAAVLCLLLYFVAKYEADYSFAKVAMVTAGITLGCAIIHTLLAPHIGAWSYIPLVGFIAVMLMTFCWITLWKSLLVVFLFSGFYAATSFGVHALKARLTAAAAVQGPTNAEDLKLAKDFQAQVAETLSPGQPSPPVGTATTQTEAAADAPAAASTSAPPVVAAAEPGSEAAWKAARAKMRIGGTVAGQGGRRFALIDQNLVEVGETVRVVQDGVVYRWKLVPAGKQGVELEPLDGPPAPPSEDQ